MKKLLSVSAVAVLIFTACQQPAAPHTHSYGDWKTVTEPTCTEKGQKKRTCACGEEDFEDILAKGHSFEDGWTKDSTNHWHKATCGHDEKSGFGAHVDSDNDYDCDDCGYDMASDLVTPTFEFDKDLNDGDGETLDIDTGSIKFEDNFKFCEENMSGEGWEYTYDGGAFILTPRIKTTKDENGKVISAVIEINEADLNYTHVEGVEDSVLYFNEFSKDNCPDHRYYILYSDLRRRCKEQGVKMTKDILKSFEDAANKAGVVRTRT